MSGTREAFILYHNREDAEKNASYIARYYRSFASHGFASRLILTDELSFEMDKGHLIVLHTGQPMAPPTFVLNRSRNAELAEILESAGWRLYNTARVSRICNNKALTYRYLAPRGIPILPVWWGGKTDEAALPYPVVLKSLSGHGGAEVFRADNPDMFREAERRLSGKPFLVQKMSGTPGRDLRVYVIGDRIVAAILRHSEKNFRSNFSLGGQAELCEPGEEVRRLVARVCQLFTFGMVGIDFVFDGETPYLNEIEDAAGARMLYQNSDIDIAALYTAFIGNDIKRIR